VFATDGRVLNLSWDELHGDNGFLKKDSRAKYRWIAEPRKSNPISPPAQTALIIGGVLVALAAGYYFTVGVRGAKALQPASRDIAMTEADSGKSVTLYPGDRLLVRLGENPSTGYHWDLLVNGPIGTVSTSDTFSEPPNTVGAPGVRTFVVTPMTPGTVDLEFRMLPPGGGPPDQTVKFHVTVANR